MRQFAGASRDRTVRNPAAAERRHWEAGQSQGRKPTRGPFVWEDAGQTGVRGWGYLEAATCVPTSAASIFRAVAEATQCLWCE
jgi:hypothetical protein